MTDPAVQDIKDATKAYADAERQLAKARSVLRRSLLKARKKTDLTDEEIARVWGKSRQSLHKFIGPQRARVKT